jgi:allantoin racemase
MTRLLYQIPGDLRAGPLGAAEIERRRGLLQGWAAANTIVEVGDAPGGPLSIESQAEEASCVAPTIAALRQRTELPDAIVVGCFSDPGRSALRELFDCVVVGPFEASFYTATQLGARVGVVTILESVVPILDRLAWSMGQSVRYAGAAAIDVPVLELKNDPARVTTLVVEAGRDLVARTSADVLVLGCMSLSFLGVAEQARERIGVPVVNPAMCALKTAEALVAQQLRPSRRTYPKPRKDVLAEERPHPDRQITTGTTS